MVTPYQNIRASLGVVNKITEGLLNTDTPLNMENMVLSEIHKSCTRKIYADVDIDPKGDDDLDLVLNEVLEIMGNSLTRTIKTHSGVHVLINKAEIDPKVKNTFWKALQGVSDRMDGEVEFKGDTMLPVPGTTQGGKIPRII
jgi:hypothetical protein